MAVPVNVVTMVNAAIPHPSHTSPPVSKKETVKVESVERYSYLVYVTVYRKSSNYSIILT